MVDEPQNINDPKKTDDEVEAERVKLKPKGKDDKKKVLSFKQFDASKFVDLEPNLDEAAGDNKPAIMTFGRMNPITVGHEKLANAVIAQAQKSGGIPYIYLSQSQDKNKNPLSYNDKIGYAQKAFGKSVIKSKAKTIIEVMVELSGKHKDVIVVVGSDRVKEFDKLLNKYNKSSAGYVFNNITVVSAGQRDPDAEGVKGMSGTKMRGFAADNDVKKFATGLPSKIKTSAAAILADVRKGMNMSENNDNVEENIEDFVENTEKLDEVLNRMQRRARGISMRKNRFKMARGRQKAARRTATMEILKKRAHKQAIRNLKGRFAKNKRYADMSAGEKEMIDKKVAKFSKNRILAMARKLLPKVKIAERERKRKKVANEDLNVQFENFMAEGDIWGQRQGKRPHMLLDKTGKTKFDKRFKMYKPNVNESIDEFDIVNLMEDTEAYIQEVQLDEKYKITKIYNPTTKNSRKAGKSTATFAVHTHDRKYFKEFPNQTDAEKHKKLKMSESVVDDFLNDLDEMDFSIKSIKKSGFDNVKKANNFDKLKSDIAAMKAKLKADKGMKPLKAGYNEGEESLADLANKRVIDKKAAGKFPKNDKKFKPFVRKKEEDEEEYVSETINSKFESFVSNLEENGAGDEGTNKLVKTLKKDTPNA